MTKSIDYIALAILIACICLIKMSNLHNTKMIGAAIMFGLGGIFMLQVPIKTIKQKYSKTAFGNVYKDKIAILYWFIFAFQSLLPLACFAFTIFFIKNIK